MAKFAVAYVEVKADLSNFGAGLGKEIEARLDDVDVERSVDRSLRPKFKGAGKELADALTGQTDANLKQTIKQAVTSLNDVPHRKVSEIDLEIRQALAASATVRAELADLGRQKATPEVDADITQAKLKFDEIKVRLARLRAEKAEVKVDIDRSVLTQLGGVADSVGTAFRGIAVSVGGLLGIGGALTGLGDAAAAALPVVAALGVAIGILVASFGAAVAGAGALGIALAGVLGPAAIVAFTALAKVAQIIKAIHDDNKDSGASTQSVVAAQDQLTSATEGLASAQANLRDQTTAAYRAWQDSIEAVKDDLLGVQDAQLGIEDASLSLKEAQLALQEFKNAAPGLEGIFKKFTNVDADLSGLNKALDGLRAGSNGQLSKDDTLKLERLILNVRRAKLGEKQATDRLHDANVNLQRDRQVETRFLKNGIAAYPGYASAVRGVATAQRQLASAQRNVASSAKAAQSEVSKLTPVEQKLANTFKLISTAFGRALGPAIDAFFGGINRGLRIFADTLADPRIVRALKGIGDALGDAFVTVSKLFASKDFRRSFEDLARGAANLIRAVGGKAFPAFVKILTSIATAALPALVGLVNEFADTLDRWARWIKKHPKEFKKRIDDLIGAFKGWLGVIIDVGDFLLGLGGKLKSLGDTVGRVFRGAKDALSDLVGGTDKLNSNLDKLNSKNLPNLTKEPPGARKGVLGFSPRDLDDIGKSFDRLGVAMHRIVDSVKPAFKDFLGGIVTGLRGAVQIAAGIISRDWGEAWRGFKNIVKGSLRTALGLLEFFIAPFRLIGRRIGSAFVGAFKGVLHTLRDIAVKILNPVIGIINVVIAGINKIPFHKDIGRVDKLKTSKQIHDQKVIDGARRSPLLTPSPGKLPKLTKTPKNLRASSSSADSNVTKVVDVGGVTITAPEAKTPDPQSAALRFARLVDALG